MKNAFLAFCLWASSTASAATFPVATGPGNVFNPATLNISVGDTVQFTMGAFHTATYDFSPCYFNVVQNTTGSFTFNAAGTYTYHCSIHGYCGTTHTCDTVTGSCLAVP